MCELDGPSNNYVWMSCNQLRIHPGTMQTVVAVTTGSSCCPGMPPSAKAEAQDVVLVMVSRKANHTRFRIGHQDVDHVSIVRNNKSAGLYYGTAEYNE